MAYQQLPDVPQLPQTSRSYSFFPQYIAKQTELLILKERILSLSGDSFDIKLANGQPIFHVKGKVMSLSGRKAFSDMEGNVLFNLRHKMLAIHTTFYGEDANEQEIFKVTSKMSIGKSKAAITFVDSITQQETTLLMKGNWLDNKAEIVDEATGEVLAMISKKLFSAKEIFSGQQNYGLIVAPGVDMALMAAATICLDEKNHEQQSTSNSAILQQSFVNSQ